MLDYGGDTVDVDKHQHMHKRPYSWILLIDEKWAVFLLKTWHYTIPTYEYETRNLTTDLLVTNQRKPLDWNQYNCPGAQTVPVPYSSLFFLQTLLRNEPWWMGQGVFTALLSERGDSNLSALVVMVMDHLELEDPSGCVWVTSTNKAFFVCFFWIKMQT